MIVIENLNSKIYKDFKVESLEQVPFVVIIKARYYGIEKYGTNGVCRIECGLYRRIPSYLHRSAILQTQRRSEHRGNEGGTTGQNSGDVRSRCVIYSDRYWCLRRWERRNKDNMVAQILFSETGVQRMNPLQVLKVDVDIDINLYDYEKLFNMRIKALQLLGYEVEKAWFERSSSGKHIHYIVILKQPVKNAEELFLLQAFLGDDPTRVELNFLRYRMLGDDALDLNVLFKEKYKLTKRLKLKIILNKIIKFFKTKFFVFTDNKNLERGD